MQTEVALAANAKYMRSGTCRMFKLAQMFLCHFLYKMLATVRY
jgi:hypothetical protein